ncbi:metal-dependent hydrolase [Nocardioides sp. zg-579]|uniref:Metal-dependent hydrolase n=1 Tax=Nocardioides marmotae TaxID=2663857 RepID=A0A6I3JGC6_9ACTN|nr:MBL fold metallo-hydrolase [Nocardioides marmotae]MCR6033521.1 metal-dependent hydrolase [Gordonia jinghuaiqii]MTB97179.1 metal-dependent hydrolase [Nocardioides marmotae]QKE02098.1 metal-dependent hydrolase [Nocardioides marmotae]
MTPPANDGPSAASLEFVGTATTILRLGPFTLLTDPNFLHRGQRAYLGKGLFSQRLTEPSLQPADLPALDGVLLSHLHGDHFDRIARRELDRGLLVATTPASSRTLTRWGFAGAHGMRTWESLDLASRGSRLRIMAVPGQHGPGPAKHVMPPVMGSVLELEEPGRPVFRVYVSGDTLFRPYLRDVVDRTGPLDAAVVHLGGTRALGVLVTMDDRQGADLVDLLRPAVTVPVHFDDYTVFRSDRADFLERCRERGLPTQLRTVERGGRVDLT